MSTNRNRAEVRKKVLVAIRTPTTYSPELRKVVLEDSAWFAEHPGRRYRARLTTAAELRDINSRGLETPASAVGWLTIAKNLGIGGRMRLHAPLVEIARNPAELDDSEAEFMFDQIKGEPQ